MPTAWIAGVDPSQELDAETERLKALTQVRTKRYRRRVALFSCVPTAEPHVGERLGVRVSSGPHRWPRRN